MDKVSIESFAWILEKSLSLNNSQLSSISPMQALILTRFAEGSLNENALILQFGELRGEKRRVKSV